MKHQLKFYQKSKRQLQQQKMGDIYKMLNEQDKAISDLINKYQDKTPTQEQYQKERRVIGYYEFVRRRNVSERARPIREKTQKSKEYVTIELPSIQSSFGKLQRNRSRQSKTLSKASRHDKDLFINNPYLAELEGDQRMKKVDHIQKAYFKQKMKGKKSMSKIAAVSPSMKSNKSKPKKNNISRQSSNRITNSDLQSFKDKKQSINKQKQQNKVESSMPVPLGYFKEDVEVDDSSEEGDVPLTFYQREYKELIRAQCLQETNFLYFSKNQAMKEWTQNLLLLFQKHDKQLVSLRKKCKYLQKFDQNFFTIDIFKEG